MKVERFNEYEGRIQESLLGAIGRAAGKGINKVLNRGKMSRLESIVDDYKDALKEYWDDFFDAAAKHSKASTAYRTSRVTDRLEARERLSRAETYLKTVEAHNKDLDGVMRNRAKSIIANDPLLKGAFDALMQEARFEAQADAKRRYKEITDKDSKDSIERYDRDHHEPGTRKRSPGRDWLFDTDVDLAGDAWREPHRGPDGTLSELGIDDTDDFTMAGESEFWDAVNKMSMRNLKTVLTALMRNYKNIKTSSESEIANLRREAKELEKRSDTSALTRRKEIDREIESAEHASAEDLSVLVERIGRVRSKIETEA